MRKRTRRVGLAEEGEGGSRADSRPRDSAVITFPSDMIGEIWKLLENNTKGT